MAVETEIKLRLPQGAEHALVLLKQHGFHVLSLRQLEVDQTFDLPANDLRQSGRLLRLRLRGGDRWTITYKGPSDQATVDSARHKSREEIEADVADGPAFSRILAELGFRPSFAYEKFRTTFKAPADAGGIVMLDETPIGDFLELEGQGYWIDQTALKLGFGHADYITSSYAALYEDYRRTNEAVPFDMKFYHP